MDDFTNRPERPINLNPMAAPTVQWFEMATKVGEELGRFVSARTQRNLDTWEQMTRCNGSPLRLFEIQQDWVKGVMHDYLQENRRIMDITGGLMQEVGSRQPQSTAARPERPNK